MRLNRDNTLTLAIDYQERLVPVMNDRERLIETSVKFIKGMGILGIPVIFTQQYTKGLGMTVKELQDAYTGDGAEFSYFDKKKYSCYADGTIKEAIDGAGKKNILICGMETHICVMMTAMDLADAGYNVAIVTDCVSTRKPEDGKIGLKRAVQENIMLTTYEAALFELTKGADMEGFKEISKLVK